MCCIFLTYYKQIHVHVRIVLSLLPTWVGISVHNNVCSFLSARGIVAEVVPGDMLVVPPFWFHHVETLEESVSVNVWSDAPEYEIMNQV